MSKIRFALQSIALLAFMLTLTSLAQAQATRTWVSGVGDDVNPCSRTAPCKTWAGAISKTAAGGEIDALDPGGFGTLTITKSITVEGTQGQGFGSTLNSGGISGFTINDSLTATPGTINVILRNLAINGAGTTLGTIGVRLLSGKSLKFENGRIMNQSSHGIEISNATQTLEVTVENSIISNCAGNGINLNSGNSTANIKNTGIFDCGNGLSNSAGTANISNSHISGCTTAGITATSGAAVINASNNSVNQNATGINGAAGSVVRINNNEVFKNTTGLSSSGTMETYRNNKVRGNTTNLTGLLTDISPVGTGIQ